MGRLGFIRDYGKFDQKFPVDRKDIIITVPCDSTDTWIVAAFDPMEEIEKIQNPWEDIISRKKDYHGIRISQGKSYLYLQ